MRFCDVRTPLRPHLFGLLSDLKFYDMHVKVSCKGIDIEASLRSCPLPISPLCLSREEGMIHLFFGSHVKIPESGLFPDWIGNNTNDLRRFDWPKCRHPLVVVN